MLQFFLKEIESLSRNKKNWRIDKHYLFYNWTWWTTIHQCLKTNHMKFLRPLSFYINFYIIKGEIIKYDKSITFLLYINSSLTMQITYLLTHFHFFWKYEVNRFFKAKCTLHYLTDTTISFYTKNLPRGSNYLQWR